MFFGAKSVNLLILGESMTFQELNDKIEYYKKLGYEVGYNL